METETSRVQKLLIEQNSEIDRLKNRIEQLEAALREIACDGEDCDCQAPQYCSYGIARLALGEKKE
jgi:hypothetical protein